MAVAGRRLKKIQTKYGTLQAAAGILDAVFGQQYAGRGTQNARKTVDRDSHSRVVEIGKAATQVDGATFLTKQYKGNPNGGPRGGEPVKVLIDGEWWELRISMTHDQFSEILQDNSILGGEIYWRSQRGSRYGPLRINTVG